MKNGPVFLTHSVYSLFTIQLVKIEKKKTTYHRMNLIKQELT